MLRAVKGTVMGNKALLPRRKFGLSWTSRGGPCKDLECGSAVIGTVCQDDEGLLEGIWCLSMSPSPAGAAPSGQLAAAHGRSAELL